MEDAFGELVHEFRVRLSELPRTKKGTEKFEADELASLSDNDCRRFLRARDGKVEAAAELARNALDWRLQYQPDKIQPSDIPIALPQGCWRWAGWARDGRPIVLVRSELWKPNQYDIEEYNRYVGYMMDNNIARARNGMESQIVLFDMKNFSMLQSDFTKIRALISINQDFYPERLSLCVVINASRIFDWVWKTIYPWIDRKTREKIHVLTTKDKYAPLLLEHIAPEQLEIVYGGARPYEYPVPPATDEYADGSWMQPNR